MAKTRKKSKNVQLREALKNHFFNEVKKLLLDGADPNTVFKDSALSLEHYFSFGNATRMLTLLFKHGLNINAQDRFEHTILEVAIYRCDQNIFRFLLRTGKLDLNAKTSFGTSPLTLAIKQARNHVCDLFFVEQILANGVDWRHDKSFFIDNAGMAEFADNTKKMAKFMVTNAVFMK